MKYENWLTFWLNNIVKSSAKLRTFIRYSELIYGHIIPSIGWYEMDDLSPIILQKLVMDLLKKGNLKTGKGLSANTVNTIITIIQNSMRSANIFGELKEYKAGNIKRPKTKGSEVMCFSADEQKKIEKAIITSKNDKLLGIIICLYSGLRIGELLALEWDDMDFVKGQLKVTKTCHYIKNENGKFERQIGTPKTRSSIRIIPLPKPILEIISSVKMRSKGRYIISNGENPISIRSYQRSFSLLLKRLNIPHKGFHALRHTFATRALECGMDVKTLSEILGHQNANITLNKYVHSLMDHKKEMMDKVGELLQ